jgi:hypothetical protein
MARRVSLKQEDQRRLARLRGQPWTVDERRWVLAHLDPRAPTLLVQALHAELVEVQAEAP